ncbi:MAG: DUF4124 domain-containing protein [Gammaproteobacteria bacterium]
MTAAIRKSLPAAGLLVLAAMTSCLSAAEIYRFVDSNGNVIYSDRPLGDNVETLLIDTATPTAPPTLTAPETTDPAEIADPTAQPGTSDSEQTESELPDLAAQGEENCAIARERNERYSIARRIYRGTEESREYLSDEELDEIRAQAAADVEEWCN